MDEPKFTQQWQGDKEPSAPVPLSTIREANRDDPEVLEWLERAPVGGGLITGGGAAPVCSLRRIS